MRILVALFLALALPLGAAAQQRQYAILSLVGDELTIVLREMSTGTRIDKNTEVKVPLGTASLDRAMLLAVDDAVRRAEPTAKPILLAPRDPRLFDAAMRSLDAGGTAAVFEAVRPVLASSKATHLLLITKHRHRAMLRLRDGHVGSGYLTGLGFYVDHGSDTKGSSVGMADAERGFISPYTYFNVAVVDIASGRVLAEQYVVGSNAHGVTSGTIGNAWRALTDQEKDAQITRLLQEEAARVVPKVLAQR
ncbi:MAG TPA: hypothetical protein VM073_12345 [Usitatibacter sp.]|nr:hypothetical protein [Usitatibacter sp.]